MIWQKRRGNAGPWKAWKTKLRFPTLSTALGNRYAIPHIPTAPTPVLTYQYKNQPKGAPAPPYPHCPPSGSFFDENMVIRRQKFSHARFVR